MYSWVPGVILDDGRGYSTSLDSYYLPQAEQPSANKVLSHHCHLTHWVHGDQDISDKWTVTGAPNNYKRSTKKPKLRFGCWDVHTMMTCLSTDLQSISDVWKTAIINRGILHLQIKIDALQVTWFTESGCLRESEYTFLWQGKKKEDVHEYGIGFEVRNILLNKVPLGSSATKHLLS